MAATENCRKSQRPPETVGRMLNSISRTAQLSGIPHRAERMNMQHRLVIICKSYDVRKRAHRRLKPVGRFSIQIVDGDRPSQISFAFQALPGNAISQTNPSTVVSIVG